MLKSITVAALAVTCVGAFQAPSAFLGNGLRAQVLIILFLIDCHHSCSNKLRLNLNRIVVLGFVQFLIHEYFRLLADHLAFRCRLLMRLPLLAVLPSAPSSVARLLCRVREKISIQATLRTFQFSINAAVELIFFIFYDSHRFRRLCW